MKKITLLPILVFVFGVSMGQNIQLTDYLLAPRLDSSYWKKDYEALNPEYSETANRCQTCVFNQTDSTRGRFCFNTSFGQVQLDTTLHNFKLEKLIGQWKVIDFGLFETTDSILTNAKVYFRSEKILKEQKDVQGFISFTKKRLSIDFKNTEGIPNKNTQYKIMNGKFLATKTFKGFCGATIIGMTKDEYLILDDHTYRTIAKAGKYLVIKTSIRRMILKRCTDT